MSASSLRAVQRMRITRIAHSWAPIGAQHEENAVGYKPKSAKASRGIVIQGVDAGALVGQRPRTHSQCAGVRVPIISNVITNIDPRHEAVRLH